MDDKSYRLSSELCSMSAQDADKLIGCGDANCALIYIYFLRRGSASSGELCRALGLSRQAVGAAAQKLKDLGPALRRQL